MRTLLLACLASGSGRAVRLPSSGLIVLGGSGGPPPAAAAAVADGRELRKQLSALATRMLAETRKDVAKHLKVQGEEAQRRGEIRQKKYVDNDEEKVLLKYSC